MVKAGDLVCRRSYGGDLLFRVVEADRFGKISLRGVNYRVLADAPQEDLILVDEVTIYRSRRENLKEIEKKMKNLSEDAAIQGMTNASSMEEGEMIHPIRVLHLDGDEEYLRLCLQYYQSLGMNATGAVIEESRQPMEVLRLLLKYRPEMLILTGHDSILRGKDIMKLENYRSSRYFIEAVRRAREYEPDMDQLVIFAGACQSFYEKILEAGANFASSPGRTLIHAMDPVIISQKIATTPIDQIVRVKDLLRLTFSGEKGVGGYETRGKGRRGYPKGGDAMSRPRQMEMAFARKRPGIGH